MKQIELLQNKNRVEYEELVETAHSLGSQLGVLIDSNDSHWVLTLMPTTGMSDNETKTLFLNALYDNTLRRSLKNQTTPIKNLIFAAAFSNIELD